MDELEKRIEYFSRQAIIIQTPDGQTTPQTSAVKFVDALAIQRVLDLRCPQYSWYVVDGPSKWSGGPVCYLVCATLAAEDATPTPAG